ncbi:MAG: hypothetical protein KME29_04895 [Calothrix sp. FI2-JRJ7]|jgi:hypothetical protein|nr:hypothetical protein [Calothrix sp. FI2-JRJ7]
MKLNLSIKGLIAVVLLAASHAPVMAQSRSHLVNLGADSQGNNYYLDARTVRSYQRFEIRKLQNQTMVQLTMSANCRERRIWVTKVERFSMNGQRLAQATDLMEEMPYEEGAPATNALRYYCAGVGVRW